MNTFPDRLRCDNRCTMHRGTDFDARRWKRDLQRAAVSDIGNTCEAAAVRLAAGVELK